MKVRVTHLKSTTWPAGTKVGDVVDLKGDAIPESLVGKCVPVDAQAPAEAKDEKKAKG